MDFRHATAADAPAMAGLFAADHHGALTERERAEQGFVQGGLGVDGLRSTAEEGSLLVATDDGRLAGLLGLAAPDSVPGLPPPVQAVLDAQDALRWDGRPLRATPWLLHGPVVVAAAHRGRGVARGLFDAALQAASGRAAAMVAFIERDDQASWKVHVDGFGMTPLAEFSIGDRAYVVVGASTRSPGSSEA